MERRKDQTRTLLQDFIWGVFLLQNSKLSCTVYEFTYLERKTLRVELEYGKTNQKKDAFFCEIVYSITVYTL